MDKSQRIYIAYSQRIYIAVLRICGKKSYVFKSNEMLAAKRNTKKSVICCSKRA